MPARRILAGLLVAVATAAPAAAQSPQSQEPPRFTSSVELTPLDATVLDGQGRPITTLTPSDFVVRVDGAVRRVVNAEWVPLTTAGAATPPAPAPDGYSSNDSGTGGRLILLVIDQPNIRLGGTLAIRNAVDAFIDGLEPNDRAAVVGIGQGAQSTPFTSDRERLKRAAARMNGQHQSAMFQSHSVSLSEAMDIRSGLPGALDRVINRECRDPGSGQLASGADFDICAGEVERDAQQISTDRAVAGRDTLSTLRYLLGALKGIDAPKTLVLISEGFLTDGQQAEVVALGALAGAARTSIYAMRLDDQQMAVSMEQSRAPMTRMDDRAARAEGLEILTGASRGTLLDIIGNGRSAFARIEAELSGYYLLGVESGPSDRDGKPHNVRVEVTRKDAVVRSRRAVALSTGDNRAVSPAEAVATALMTPLPVSGLPLRVATFSLEGREPGRVQLLLHADVGTDYSTSRAVSLAYTISDLDGRIVESQSARARLPPVMAGVPSALQFTGGASLPPGDYVLKLAVGEGDRVGTVEHAFHAGTTAKGRLRVSDLMTGGPIVASSELMQPTVGYRVVFGSLHGFLEAYGEDVRGLTAQYDVLAGDDEVLLSMPVQPKVFGGTRAIFTQTMVVRQLPPGPYRLRVTINDGDTPVTTLTRGFEVGTAAVLMTSAATASDVAVPVSEVYLPVPETALSRPLDREAMLRPDTVRAFRGRVPAEVREQFDEGIRLLQASSYQDAATRFKGSLDTEGENTALLAYLAATFAAAGNDTEAAGAWQTSLIDGSDLPEIYDWLSGALMRTRSLAEARAILEEAVVKFPDDARFAKPLALVYATFGLGLQSVRLLERHLAAHPDDIESLQLAVEWIYQLRQANLSVRTPADDTRLARGYADAYAKAKGPQAALVRQWMDAIDGRRR